MLHRRRIRAICLKRDGPLAQGLEPRPENILSQDAEADVACLDRRMRETPVMPA
jgi:hypothetical protein